MLGRVNENTNQTGKTSSVEMYNWIKQGGQAYVRDAYGNMAYLIAKMSPWGNPFVQTIADGRPTDNLLYLVGCR
jgi:hypothetical protein